MATESKQMQALIRHYKDQTGKAEVEMHDVAKFAVAHGWRLPTPPDPIDILARRLSKAAREETRRDPETGRCYRANHAVTLPGGDRQLTFWVDIDEAPRSSMLMSLTQRREQMVGDALQLTRDAEHWSRLHPTEDPIQLELDFGPDVQWRNNAPDDEANAA